jgi:hypothetical protein
MTTLVQAGMRARESGRPVRFDDDLVCNRCGEPWDAYGVRHGDMTAEERMRFLAGEGCPCCPKGEAE